MNESLTNRARLCRLDSKNAIRTIGTMLTLAIPIGSLVGCGGTGSSSTRNTGRAVMTISWPVFVPTRLIPVASNSITVAFLNGTSIVSTQTVPRPIGNTTTLTFTDLPATSLTLKADAYPTTTGTGTAQASASKPVTIVAGITTSLSITMASTITAVSIAPASPTVAVGGTTNLSALFVDSVGATVLTSAATTSWSSSNTSIATVSSTGVVTGVALGTATITVTESESAKSGSVVLTVSGSSGGSIVDLANAYINSLTSSQKSVTVFSSNASNVAHWSSGLASPGAGSTNSLRNGVSFSALTADQKTAFVNLAQAALGIQGYNQFTQIRNADNYLNSFAGSVYSGDYQYIGFIGIPSTSGAWVLQIGGHNVAHNFYYTGGTLNSSTPYSLGAEPQSFTYSGTAYTPLLSQRNGMFDMINSLTASQLASALLSTTFTDVALGSGKDARSNFPTGTSGRGILVSSLSGASQNLVKTAIAAWTQNSPIGLTYQSLYESELSSTYVAYSGSTALSTQGDYVRIDGPHVWIEFVVQNDVVLAAQVHFQSIWRDRVSDYNAAFGF